MKKCFITRLDGSISNNELLRIGELRVCVVSTSAPTQNTQKMTFVFNKDSILEIIGDGYFTDSTLTINKGKSLNVSANNMTDVYVSNGNFYVSVLDKYALTSIDINSENIAIPEVGIFKYCTSMFNLNLHTTKSSGDISQLSTLTNFRVLNLSDTKISGNVGSMKSLTDLTTLNFNNTKVSGDVDQLSTLTNLISFGATNTTSPLQANISTFNNMDKLEDISFSYSKLMGDLATLPSSLKRLLLYEDAGSVLNWSSRATSANIFAINGNPKCEDIDTMLINLAQCKVGFTSNDDSSFRLISIRGVRTSLSDDAVATLQSKGYTVSVNS